MYNYNPSMNQQLLISWQKSDDGGNSWSGVSGATSSVYTTPSLVYANDNNDQYRCEVNAPGALPQFTQIQ